MTSKKLVVVKETGSVHSYRNRDRDGKPVLYMMDDF